MTCAYPTKEPDPTQKSPTLRDISNRLEQLESCYRFWLERSEVSAGYAADVGGGRGRGCAEPEIPI